MIDDRTPYLDLPLPHPNNLLSEDVGRLRQAVITLDAGFQEQAAQVAASLEQAQSDVTTALSNKADIVHHHDSAEISDSTTIGREVLTAADAATARSALGIKSSVVYSYDNRASLRTLAPESGDSAIIDGLGLFVWHLGSDEPDDDESCFATADGRWLLEAVHWDVVDAWQSPDWDAAEEPDSTKVKFLTTTFTNSISTVYAQSKVSLTFKVFGAEVGDAVIVTRGGAISGAGIDGVVFGVVSANDVVTIYFCAGYGTYSYFDTSNPWRVTVIKQ